MFPVQLERTVIVPGLILLVAGAAPAAGQSASPGSSDEAKAEAYYAEMVEEGEKVKDAMQEMIDAIAGEHMVYGPEHPRVGGRGRLQWLTAIEFVEGDMRPTRGDNLRLVMEFRVVRHQSHVGQFEEELGGNYENPAGESFRIEFGPDLFDRLSSREVDDLEFYRHPATNGATFPSEMLSPDSDDFELWFNDNVLLKADRAREAAEAFRTIFHSWKRMHELHEKLDDLGYISLLDQLAEQE